MHFSVCAVPKSRNAAALSTHSCNSNERNRKEICGVSSGAGAERTAFSSRPDEKYGIRDTALLCLLYDSGARVQELIDLSLLDIRLETPATIRLYGKGRKVRVVPLMSQTAVILQKYLSMWHLDAVRKPDAPVFVNHQGKRLTRPGVTYILNKYMAQVSWMEGKKELLRMLSAIPKRCTCSVRTLIFITFETFLDMCRLKRPRFTPVRMRK